MLATVKPCSDSLCRHGSEKRYFVQVIVESYDKNFIKHSTLIDVACYPADVRELEEKLKNRISFQVDIDKPRVSTTIFYNYLPERIFQ